MKEEDTLEYYMKSNVTIDTGAQAVVR